MLFNLWEYESRNVQFGGLLQRPTVDDLRYSISIGPSAHPLQYIREGCSLLRTVWGSVGRVARSVSPGRHASAGMVLKIAEMSAIVKIQFR
jgi:hypothetical protein